MFFSLAIILLFGLLLGGICKKLRLPSLIGMLAVGNYNRTVCTEFN